MNLFPGLAFAAEDLALAMLVDPHWESEALRASLGGADNFEAALAFTDAAFLPRRVGAACGRVNWTFTASTGFRP